MLLSSLLLGCPAPGTTPPPGTLDSGATIPTSDTSSCATMYSGPTVIESWSVECAPNAHLRVLVQTTGWVQDWGDSAFFAIDSGGGASWSENHPLNSNGNRGPCGAEDELALDLLTNAGTSAGFPTYEPMVSSYYTCEDHYDAVGMMSYAIQVADITGAMADCVAFGADPGGLVEGEYVSMYGSAPQMDWSSCRVAVAR